MANLIVAFPKEENAARIRSLLMRSGYHVVSTCTSGTAALQAADRLGSGALVCGYRFKDMLCSDLYESLPATFGMLVVASESRLSEGVPDGVSAVAQPLKVRDLVQAVDEVLGKTERENAQRRPKRRERSEEENQILATAKERLMQKNGMTEEEAHRYLQKTSMNSGTGLVETAQMILRLMAEDA